MIVQPCGRFLLHCAPPGIEPQATEAPTESLFLQNLIAGQELLV